MNAWGVVGFNLAMCALQAAIVAMQLGAGKTGFAVFHAVAAGFFLGMASAAVVFHRVRAK